MQIKVKTWIEDNKKNLIFGSGKTEILEYIDLTGSISKAAQKVGMNYKKAWSHIQILENFIEDDLVITQKGRGENSGSKLTPKARELIALYKILDKDIKNYANERFQELFEKNIINAKENKDV